MDRTYCPTAAGGVSGPLPARGRLPQPAGQSVQVRRQRFRTSSREGRSLQLAGQSVQVRRRPPALRTPAIPRRRARSEPACHCRGRPRNRSPTTPGTADEVKPGRETANRQEEQQQSQLGEEHANSSLTWGTGGWGRGGVTRARQGAECPTAPSRTQLNTRRFHGLRCPGGPAARRDILADYGMSPRGLPCLISS